MLDIKKVRANPTEVKARLAERDPELAAGVDNILYVDHVYRTYLTEIETLKAQVNSASKTIGQLMREGKAEEALENRVEVQRIKELIEDREAEIRSHEDEINRWLFNTPNLPHETTPPGPEENFQIVKTNGETPRFDFAAKAHWDIATDLGLIDFARGTKLSGSGFVLYRGLGAMLERGLIAFMLDLHTARHGYTEWSTPFFLSRDSVRASAHLPKFQPEMYHDAEADLFALPTAEPALVNIHRDEILDGRDFPLNYVAYSPCWRREAGAAGKDTRGLLRVHQFDKVEMVKYVLPETSYDELETLVTNATDVLEALGLCYRIKLLAAGDISFAAAKCYDIEIYAPGADAWLEVSSCSNCEDFQSRRGSIRFRREPGAKPEFPHLLNASGTALPRLVATLLETYQRPDGRVTVPPALSPYVGGRTVLEKEQGR